MADDQGGLLYPLNWTIFLLDVAYAMLIVQLMSVIIGIVGMMFYLRHLKIGWAPTMLAAIVFGSCVFTQSFNMAIG